MEAQVLVLNAAYQVVGIIPWRDAMTKLYAEKATERVEIVSTYQDKVIRTASTEIPMPSVVRHIKYTKSKSNGIKFSRDHVWARDRGKCQYCGFQVPRDDYTYDHVIPKSKGGKTDWFNIVACCKICNAKKGNRTVKEAKMTLLSKPVRPDFLPIEFKSKLKWRATMPDEWKPWIDGQYWHGGD